MMFLTGNSHPIETRGSRVSRAPPHHTYPAFLNLQGIKTAPTIKTKQNLYIVIFITNLYDNGR